MDKTPRSLKPVEIVGVPRSYFQSPNVHGQIFFVFKQNLHKLNASCFVVGTIYFI